MPLFPSLDSLLGRKHRGSGDGKGSVQAEPESPLLALLAERIDESDPSEREEACRHLEAMAQSMATDLTGYTDGEATACARLCVNVVRDLVGSLDGGRLAFRTEPELLAYVRRAVENRIKQRTRSECAAGPPPPTPPTPPAATAATEGMPAEPSSNDVAGAAAGSVRAEPTAAPTPEHPPPPPPAKQAEMLPQLDAFVEINRGYARMVDALTEHLSQATKGTDSLPEALARLGEASTRQIEMLASLRQQLEINNQTTARMAEALEDLRRTLERMSGASSDQPTTGAE